jgi:hypothetical protein
MDFEKEDNWSDVPNYRGKAVFWEVRPISDHPYFYHAHVGGQDWWLRLNNFPEEPCFTLMVGGQEIIHLNDWPPEWKKKE